MTALRQGARRFALIFLGTALAAFQAFSLTVSNGPITPGVWNSGFSKAKAYAEQQNLPLVVFWGSSNCGYCSKLKNACSTVEFADWQASCGLVLCQINDTNTTDGQAAKNFVGRGSYPLIRIYWLRKDGTKADVRFVGRDGQMKNGGSGSLARQFINAIEAATAGFASGGSAPDPYLGGTFAGEKETAGHRLEAEAGTAQVPFALVRDEAAAKVATNHLFTVTGPDGAVATNTVVWQADEAEQALALNLEDYPAFDADGETLTLAVLDAGGEVQDTRTVTFVARANGAENPLWIGERTAETLAFGEWTMDFEAATNKAARADGEAYTLVAVSGALWCPDCANTERNFLDVADAEGENRFKAWAASNGVALVTVDVPNFQADGAFESPTFLSRRAFATTLARTREYPDSGADAALTNAMLRSGLGYLTRKGVSDEEAAAALARNYALVRRGGLLHSPIDTSDNRTGVPIFVLLRKDGTVAARLTRFAARSPMASAREQWGDIIKRFDEMLAVAASAGTHADPAEFTNDAPQGAVGFAANGGTAEGELSHADFRDVFRLDGVGGNALQKVTVTGTTGARATASFLALDADGKKVTVGTPVTGTLTEEGFALEHTFTAAGTYYVEVAGADITDAAFAVESPKEMNFHPYALAGTVVLVPQETRATATPPTGSDQVVMRLEKGQKYRIEGLKADAASDALEPDASEDIFFTALRDGDAVLTCAAVDGAVTYSRWNPGTVGFTAAEGAAREDVGTVRVAVARTAGKSGRVELKVSLDAEATTLYDSDGKARFAFEATTLAWEEGETGEKTVTIAVLDDIRFDGTGVVALTLEQVGGDGTPEVAGGTFALTVTDDDKQSAGKVAFTGAEPYFARAKTVYVRESKEATVKVGRVEASDGPVTVRVMASPASVVLGGDDIQGGILSWANHRAEEKSVKVAGLTAGRTATLTLANATDGLRILSASNYVKVVAVAANAPAFAQDAAQVPLTRYVAASNVYDVVDVPEGTTKLSFTKLSGTLPAGLKAAWDPAVNALAVSGATTAKAGAYTAVYQVVASVGAKKVPGLTLALRFTVADVALPGADGAPALNPALAKARTFRDLPVLDEVNTNLVGTLQVTVPPTGRVSAKWLCATGTVSFTARNWSEAKEDGTVRAELVGSKMGYAMALEAAPDGSLTIELTDDRGETAQVWTDGRLWSKEDSAEGWRGQYTVSLRNAAREESESAKGLAPRGHGYLTLKMTSATACNSGRMTWAGLLPNGTVVSGSATLARGLGGPKDCWGYLPVYMRSSRDVLAVLAQVAEGAAAHDAPKPSAACQAVFEAADFAEAYWSHADSVGLRYTVEWDVYGGVYSPAYDFAAYFAEFYEEGSVARTLVFDVDGLAGTLAAGTPQAVAPVGVVIGARTLAVDPNGPNVCRATLSFNRATGVVSGTFRLPVTKADDTETTVTASYRGVMLIGWGPGCGCEDSSAASDVKLPFVSGAFWVADKATDAATGRARTVKRGGAADIAVPAAVEP